MFMVKIIFSIFFICLSCVNYLSAQGNIPVKCFYLGTIGKNNIQMELSFDKAGVKGRYCYDKHGEYLSLEGNGSFNMTELFEGVKTGNFFPDIQNKKLYRQDEINGKWTNPDGKVKVGFNLKKVAEYVERRSGTSDVSFRYPKFVNGYEYMNKVTAEIENLFEKSVRSYKSHGSYSTWDYKIEYLHKDFICISVYNDYNDGYVVGTSMYSSVCLILNGKLRSLKFGDIFNTGSDNDIKNLCMRKLVENGENDSEEILSLDLPIIHGYGMEFIIPSERSANRQAGSYNCTISFDELSVCFKPGNPLDAFIDSRIKTSKIKAFRWKYNGKINSIPVTGIVSTNAGTALNVSFYEEKLPDEMEGEGYLSSETDLLSAIGPIISYYENYNGYHGAGGWVSEYVKMRCLDGYKFSLSDHLKKIGRFKKEYREDEIDNFWFVSWDGVNVMLGIQLLGVRMMRSCNSMEYETISIFPPQEWLPWLESAAGGQGLFQDKIQDWNNKS